MNKPFKITKLVNILKHVDDNSIYAINYAEINSFNINLCDMTQVNLAYKADLYTRNYQ